MADALTSSFIVFVFNTPYIHAILFQSMKVYKTMNAYNKCEHLSVPPLKMERHVDELNATMKISK